MFWTCLSACPSVCLSHSWHLFSVHFSRRGTLPAWQYLYHVKARASNGNNLSRFIIPREKGILFSVCLSLRLFGTLFSHFVGVTPPTFFITHKQNLYHLKAGCLECVMGVRCSVPPPKFWRDRSLKTAQNHIPIFRASQIKEFWAQ